MTVPVTDRKRPTSLDFGITSLVISGHSGKPEDTRERFHMEEEELMGQHGAELLALYTTVRTVSRCFPEAGTQSRNPKVSTVAETLLLTGRNLEQDQAHKEETFC